MSWLSSGIAGNQPGLSSTCFQGKIYYTDQLQSSESPTASVVTPYKHDQHRFLIQSSHEMCQCAESGIETPLHKFDTVFRFIFKLQKRVTVKQDLYSTVRSQTRGCPTKASRQWSISLRWVGSITPGEISKLIR
jgi:hypothetical protein